MANLLSIGSADMMLMQHLRLGGATSDSVGRRIVNRIIEIANEYPNVRKVIDEEQASLEDLGLMYTAVIDDLMPNPCIDAGRPCFVPFVFFSEPPRLRELLLGVNRDARSGSPRDRTQLLVKRAVEQGRLIRQEALADPARNKIPFDITPGSGVQPPPAFFGERPAQAGCAGTLVLVFAPLAILTAWACF